MADKAISELVSAEQITATDMFVLEQNGTAKKLTGQVLLNWLTAAADGHGGIQSIVKRSTSGLADTYRITLADTTVYDFVVTNGRGINSLQKVGTSGLVDTYRFNYNDGTTSTFTVTNGAKGDKGDNSYIWIKYASQQPTASSNSFGDIPDDWMGIYFGTASTAPTSWQSYKWYQIKGEQGDTGAPATLVSAQITYQMGDSGTIIPSGSWSSSVPPVTPGRYLWTRQVLQFNTGNPVTSYSVSRFGIDGSGAVSTVAGVAPDPSGNVPLTADSVKALPLAGGTMQGGINMNGQRLTGLNAPTADDEAATKGFVENTVKNVDLSGKVDKANVVNNFTTTTSGYVADARALKVLNDSKLSMELLWENGSPTSSFGSGLVTLNNMSRYSYFRVLLTGYTDADIQQKVTCECAMDYEGAALCFFTDGSYYRRNCKVTTTGIQFYDAISTKGNVDDKALIPFRIYGVKGGN